MDSDLSYSMYVDKNISNTDILPKTNELWVDDKKSKLCFKCKQIFTIFKRKHHCRGCGHIFCYDCSNKYIHTDALNKYNIIDKELFIKEDYTIKYNSHRVCKDCYKLFNNLKLISSKIKVLELLSINIINIYKFKGLSKLWNKACMIYLSKFRDLQYILPSKKLTKLELHMLHNNIHLIGNHNKLLTLYIKSIDWDNTSEKKINIFLKNIEKESISCWKLMCGRCCKKTFTISDILDIIYNITNNYIRTYFINKLQLTVEQLDNYLPFLIKCVTKDDILIDYLIEKSSNNVKLRILLFSYIIISIKQNPNNDLYKIFLQKYKDYLIKNFEENIYLNIKNTFHFLQLFCNLSVINHKKLLEKINVFLGENIINVPPNFCDRLIKIDDNIEIKNSFTKPIIFKCYCFNKEKNKYYYKKLMYKNEDVRIDSIIVRIIKEMKNILNNNNINLPLIIYDIIPITMNSGIIEIVEKSDSIYDIRKTKLTLQNYILELNSNETIEIIRERFIKSTANYCIISYLLGIGDRHLDNIMVTNKGELFHIDYTYCLGQDTKMFAPEIRLTYDMIDTIGGENSKNFNVFKNYCNTIFKTLRSNHHIIMLLLFSLIENDNIYNTEMVEQLILKRFIPSELEQNAEIQLITTLENGKDSYHFIDFLHYHSKEQTVSNTFYNLVDTTTYYFRNFFR